MIVMLPTMVKGSRMIVMVPTMMISCVHDSNATYHQQPTINDDSNATYHLCQELQGTRIEQES